MTSVNVRDVASRAGVSIGTVSNVLNHPEIVAPLTRDRVKVVIDELGFVRNDLARQLRAGMSRAVGLVVLDIGNPFFSDVARGAETEAAASGRSLLLGNSDESSSRESAYLDLFEEQRAHGVLISPVDDIADRLRRLRHHGIPVVLVDRTSDDRTLSSVTVDNVRGGALAVRHLIDQGRRRIAFVGPPRIPQVADRLTGARAEVAREPSADLEIITTSALSALAGRAVGAALLARDPAVRPDAIFAANDLLALGILQALYLSEPGLVPDEISIVGYDDIDFAHGAVVPLTSIRQPSGLLGQKAMEILIAEAADPGLPARQVVFQPELIVRRSTERR